MEWATIWRTVFCGWDGDVDFAALAEELHASASAPGADDRDGASWVCRQIQEAY